MGPVCRKGEKRARCASRFFEHDRGRIGDLLLAFQPYPLSSHPFQDARQTTRQMRLRFYFPWECIVRGASDPK
jgi:hypothetical protein